MATAMKPRAVRSRLLSPMAEPDPEAKRTVASLGQAGPFRKGQREPRSGTFEALTIPLRRGDRLRYFADGAFEVEDAEGRPSRVGRLAERFRAVGAHPTFPAFCEDMERDRREHTRQLRRADGFTATLAALRS